jgi:hypothetical protein
MRGQSGWLPALPQTRSPAVRQTQRRAAVGEVFGRNHGYMVQLALVGILRPCECRSTSSAYGSPIVEPLSHLPVVGYRVRREGAGKRREGWTFRVRNGAGA